MLTEEDELAVAGVFWRVGGPQCICNVLQPCGMVLVLMVSFLIAGCSRTSESDFTIDRSGKEIARWIKPLTQAYAVKEGLLRWDTLALSCRNGKAWVVVPEGEMTQENVEITVLNRRRTSWQKVAGIDAPNITFTLHLSPRLPPAVYWSTGGTLYRCEIGRAPVEACTRQPRKSSSTWPSGAYVSIVGRSVSSVMSEDEKEHVFWVEEEEDRKYPPSRANRRFLVDATVVANELGEPRRIAELGLRGGFLTAVSLGKGWCELQVWTYRKAAGLLSPACQYGISRYRYSLDTGALVSLGDVPYKAHFADYGAAAGKDGLTYLAHPVYMPSANDAVKISCYREREELWSVVLPSMAEVAAEKDRRSVRCKFLGHLGDGRLAAVWIDEAAPEQILGALFDLDGKRVARWQLELPEVLPEGLRDPGQVLVGALRDGELLVVIVGDDQVLDDVIQIGEMPDSGG